MPKEEKPKEPTKDNPKIATPKPRLTKVSEIKAIRKGAPKKISKL